MSAALALAPRAVFSVLDSAYRDLAVADAVAAGHFESAGHTVELGRTPDWRSNPFPEDKEWRIEWVKFYYGLDLAHAFATTGESRYLATWTRLVASYIAQVPPGSDDTEVAARRIQNWIYAWNRFVLVSGVGVVSEALATQLVEYLWREVEQVRANLTKERNHRTLELYALLVAVLAFPHLDRGGALRDFAFGELHANLLADIRPDGVHRECSTHYHCIVLRSFLGALHNARMTGMPVPKSYVERVTLAAEFALHCHRPDGHIPACSDADSASYRDVLLLAARLLDRPDFMWGATLGREGHAPSRRFASFPHGGYYVQRSGWATERPFAGERFLIFDCGPLGDGGHGHYDQLSVEVASGGGPVLVDPGRFTYSETPPNWRHWFKGTAAHNTVLVDGTDQTPYARRRPTGPVAKGRLLARGSAPRLDVVVGQCVSPSYDAVHTRSVLFVTGEYWLVCDHLQADRSHAYQLRWHLSPEAGAGVSSDAIHGSRIEATGVTLAFAPPGSLHVEEGWYAPRYGVKQPAPVVVMTTHEASTTLLTAIHPCGSVGSHAPVSPRLISSSHDPSEPTVVEVTGTGPDGMSVDVLTWSSDGHTIALAGFEGTARAAWSRTNAQGQCDAFTAVDVQRGAWTLEGDTVAIGVDGETDGLWASWSEGAAFSTSRSEA